MTELPPGASSYFSKPALGLDPNLFGPNERVRTSVHALILNTLFGYWRTAPVAVAAPDAWAQLYLAGSGASYQWNADRSAGGEPGDLDVLIAVDWELYYAHQTNDAVHFAPPEVVADALNEDLHTHLWPRTAHTRIGDTVYELTYYINPMTGPIQAIHPYAAYNLTLNRWAVHPDPHPVHPQVAADYEAVEDDRQAVAALARDYDRAFDAVVAAYNSAVGAPVIVNAEASFAVLVGRASALLEEIHGARNDAFSEHGEGYADNANFRWQAAKANGTIAALRRMAGRGPNPTAPVQASDQLHRRAVDQALKDRP